MSPSLLIVDDHDAFRRFAAAMLADEGFTLAGEACDGESAVLEVSRLTPEVVLLDVQLPGIDGFEVARRIAALDLPEAVRPQVVMTSSRSAGELASRLADAPVRGFVTKGELCGEAVLALLAPV